MMISSTPNVFSRSIVISKRVRPLIATRALGVLSVRGRRRVPRPAARIMAFIAGRQLRCRDGREISLYTSRPIHKNESEKQRCRFVPFEMTGPVQLANSFAHLFEFDVAEVDVEAIAVAEALGELFGEKDGAVLAAGAAEGDHQTLEAAGLIVGDAGVHKRIDRRQELVNAFLLIQILDDRCVFSSEFLEFFFAAGIRKAAAVKNEAATVAAFIFGKLAVERKAANPDNEVVGFVSNAE